MIKHLIGEHETVEYDTKKDQILRVLDMNNNGIVNEMFVKSRLCELASHKKEVKLGLIKRY